MTDNNLPKVVELLDQNARWASGGSARVSDAAVNPLAVDDQVLVWSPERLLFHPLADIFPMVSDEQLRELAQDIVVRGLLEPIALHDGKILDGRCRYLACEMAGVPTRYQNYDGDDPVGFVVSRNLHRRHLNDSQRAMVAAQLADLQIGANQHTRGEGLPIGRAADLLNVSQRSVARAKRVLRHGDPEIVLRIEAGEIALSAAADLSRRLDGVAHGEGQHPAEQPPAKAAGLSADTSRTSPGVTIRAIKAHYDDFLQLPHVEQVKILDAHPEDVDLLIADATVRQSWKPPFRELVDFLDAKDRLGKHSIGAIVDAIPAEQLAAVIDRIESIGPSLKPMVVALHAKSGRSRHSSAREEASAALQAAPGHRHRGARMLSDAEVQSAVDRAQARAEVERRKQEPQPLVRAADRDMHEGADQRYAGEKDDKTRA